MSELSKLARKYSIPQLPKYLASMLDKTRANCWHYIPRFYVIPKIHKNLVKARLIVPCYSIVQTLTGVFVSKSLKPIIKSASFIIHRSKDLVLKLSKLSLPHYR